MHYKCTHELALCQTGCIVLADRCACDKYFVAFSSASSHCVFHNCFFSMQFRFMRTMAYGLITHEREKQRGQRKKKRWQQRTTIGVRYIDACGFIHKIVVSYNVLAISVRRALAHNHDNFHMQFHTFAALCLHFTMNFVQGHNFFFA